MVLEPVLKPEVERLSDAVKKQFFCLHPSPASFEVLDFSFVLLCSRKRRKSAQISPLSGFWIPFSRIEPVLSGREFSDDHLSNF